MVVLTANTPQEVLDFCLGELREKSRMLTALSAKAKPVRAEQLRIAACELNWIIAEWQKIEIRREGE